MRNIVTEASGFRHGIHPATRAEALFIFFDDILDRMVMYTNVTGRHIANQRFFIWRKTNREEISAFVRLHILAGVLKAHHRDIRKLYEIRDGVPLFRVTMSCERLEQLKAAARFDDPLRRDRSDKLAPVRFVCKDFNSKLLSLYKPTAQLTIDEMLIEFHGSLQFLRVHSIKAREVRSEDVLDY